MPVEDLQRLLVQLILAILDWLERAPVEDSLWDALIPPLIAGMMTAVITASVVLFATLRVEKKVVDYSREKDRRDRALVEVLRPLDQILRDAGPAAVPGARPSARAGLRWTTVGRDVGRADDLLKHPLGRWAPRGALDAADRWVHAEHDVQSRWESQPSSGPVDRAMKAPALNGRLGEDADPVDRTQALEAFADIGSPAPSDELMQDLQTRTHDTEAVASAREFRRKYEEETRRLCDCWRAARRSIDEVLLGERLDQRQDRGRGLPIRASE